MREDLPEMNEEQITKNKKQLELLHLGLVSEEKRLDSLEKRFEQIAKLEKELILEIIEDIDNVLHAQEEDWREILEVMKEEYEIKLKNK